MKEIKITDVRHHHGDSAFLIDDGKTSVLYDSGFGFTGDKVAENIKKQLGQRELDYIFLTHSHYDHALGSAYVLQHYPNARVAAGSYAAGIFKREGAQNIMRELDGKFAAQCGITDYPFLGDKLRVDIPLEDGDTVQAGTMTFKAINLPGHTKCSVAFYLEEEGLLLSCETPGIFDGEENILPSFLVGYQMTLDSIQKLKSLNIRKVLIPHFGIISEHQTQYYLSKIEDNTKIFAQLIADKIKQGISDDELTEYFVKTYRKGYFEKIYPTDAMRLNTSIMIKLIRKEFSL